MSIEMQVPRPGTKGFMISYLEALALVERLHRLLLDVIKDEFERVGVLEINAVQALLLFNIGD
ncbi:MAG: MarR family transcriptional regulator, partial [Pseudomonadota bacterium]